MRTKILYGKTDLILQEKQVGESHYTTVDIKKYGDLPQMDTSLSWPTHETEIQLTTPPKGRPKHKRPLSSPDTTPNIIIKPKNKKINLRAESSASDYTSDDEDTNEVARIQKIITQNNHKITTTKKGNKTLSK